MRHRMSGTIHVENWNRLKAHIWDTVDALGVVYFHSYPKKKDFKPVFYIKKFFVKNDDLFRENNLFEEKNEKSYSEIFPTMKWVDDSYNIHEFYQACELGLPESRKINPLENEVA